MKIQSYVPKMTKDDLHQKIKTVHCDILSRVKSANWHSFIEYYCTEKFPSLKKYFLFVYIYWKEVKKTPIGVVFVYNFNSVIFQHGEILLLDYPRNFFFLALSCLPFTSMA